MTANIEGAAESAHASAASTGAGSIEVGPEDRPRLGSEHHGPTTSEPRDEPGRPIGSSSSSFEAAEAVPKALRIVGSIVAPTTLVTALFFYFGLLYAISFFRYFGVNYTVLDMPVQGFLILSASTAILPLAFLASAGLLVIWIYQLPIEYLSRKGRSLLWVLFLTVALAGIVLVSLAAANAALGAKVFPPGFIEARGLSLSVGLVLLAYSGRVWRTLTCSWINRRAPARKPVALIIAKWGALSLLIGVGVFWAVGSYAIRMGTDGARGLASTLGCAPDVILYSQKSLNLESAGLLEEAGSAGAYPYRYSGLKLVPQSGDKYLLLPADWTPAGRPAILLSRSDAIRLEFVTVTRSQSAGC